MYSKALRWAKMSFGCGICSLSESKSDSESLISTFFSECRGFLSLRALLRRIPLCFEFEFIRTLTFARNVEIWSAHLDLFSECRGFLSRLGLLRPTPPLEGTKASFSSEYRLTTPTSSGRRTSSLFLPHENPRLHQQRLPRVVLHFVGLSRCLVWYSLSSFSHPDENSLIFDQWLMVKYSAYFFRFCVKMHYHPLNSIFNFFA